jgi:hypothetical protein
VLRQSAAASMRKLVMTLNGLKGKYARLREEIDSLGCLAEPTEAKLTRLMCELDQVERDLVVYRRLAQTAPTLSDEVASFDPVARRHIGRGPRQAMS